MAGQLFWAVLGQVGVSTSIGLDPVCILRACYSAAGRAHGKPLSAYVCDAPPSDLLSNTTRKEGRKEAAGPLGLVTGTLKVLFCRVHQLCSV